MTTHRQAGTFQRERAITLSVARRQNWRLIVIEHATEMTRTKCSKQRSKP